MVGYGDVFDQLNVPHLIRDLIELSAGHCTRTDEMLMAHTAHSQLTAQVLDLQRAKGAQAQQLHDLQQVALSPGLSL